MEKPLASSNPMLYFQIRTPSTGVRPSTTLFHGLLMGFDSIPPAPPISGARCAIAPRGAAGDRRCCEPSDTAMIGAAARALGAVVVNLPGGES